LTTLAQRRHGERVTVQTRQQIGVELALGGEEAQIDVGGGDQLNRSPAVACMT
jgi:hypothetical protein